MEKVMKSKKTPPYLKQFFKNLPSFESTCTTIRENMNIYNFMPQLVNFYFQRINILLPLFTYNQFVNKKRDNMLIYSMTLVGLNHIGCNNKLSDLKTFLKDKLLQHLQPSQLKVTLSAIQSMVVLLNELKGSSSALPSYYFSNLHNYCILLGLRLSYKTNSKRYLCYSAVVFSISVDDPYSNLQFDTHDLWKKENAILKLSENKSVLEIISLTYSNYYYKCGMFFKHLFDSVLHIQSFILDNSNLKLEYYATLRFFAFLITLDIISIYSRWLDNVSTLFKQILDQFDKPAKNDNLMLI